MPGSPPSAQPLKCASCNAELRVALICDQCRSFQPSSGAGWFALLGLPAVFDLDADALDAAYFRAARLAHPDRHSDAQEVVRVAAGLNEAYQVLRSPRLRAEYLLERAGGASAADDKSVAPGVLAETLELRESIDEARDAGDRAALDRLAGEIAQAQARTEQQAFDLARGLPGDEAVRAALRAALNALKYYEKLREQL